MFTINAHTLAALCGFKLVRGAAFLAAVMAWSYASVAQSDSRLTAESSGDQRIRVLVRMTQELQVKGVDPVDFVHNKVEQLLQRKKSRRAKTQDELMRYKYVPIVSAQVNAEELNRLVDEPSLQVFEDSIKRPALAQSVSRVYPTQSDSEFHGDNQWAVAVLDTGIEKSHPFLQSKVISEACFSGGDGQAMATSLCPANQASSTAIGSGLPCDINGCEHGTQVAGAAVGNGNNVNGVAKDGLLISVQVYSQINDESFCFPDASCLGAFTSDIIAGLERVYELRNTFSIAAVNISLGSDELFSGSCDEQPEQPIIDLLTNAGIAVVAASGNSGNSSRIQSPACISNAIAVAATFDTQDTPWSGNNINNEIDLFAPGVNINTSALNGSFASATGTSMAAPHVAGAFAVIKHASPSTSVSRARNLLKAGGPMVTQNTVSRRRLDLSTVLSRLGPSTPRPPNPRPVGGSSVVPPLLLLLLDDE